MGKSKGKKKRTTRKKNSSNNNTHKSLPAIIALCAILLVAIGVLVFRAVSCSDMVMASSLCDTEWIPDSAVNETGDEVELAEVYNSKYANYQGKLDFSQDGRFSLWMSPGDPEDGTHEGTYELNSDGKIHAVFDDGAETDFLYGKDGDKINEVVIDYDNYVVSFTAKTEQQ